MSESEVVPPILAEADVLNVRHRLTTAENPTAFWPALHDLVASHERLRARSASDRAALEAEWQVSSGYAARAAAAEAELVVVRQALTDLLAAHAADDAAEWFPAVVRARAVLQDGEPRV